MKNYLCVLVLGLASRFHVGMAVSASDMKTHLTNTFNNYDTRVRPVYSDQSNAVHVTMDLYVIGINSFDSAEQKLTTTAYLHNSEFFYQMTQRLKLHNLGKCINNNTQ